MHCLSAPSYIHHYFLTSLIIRKSVYVPSTIETFYSSSPPPTFLNEIAGFKTSSRPYLLKYNAPATPSSSCDSTSSTSGTSSSSPLQTRKYMESFCFKQNPSSSVPISHKRSLNKITGFGEGSYHRRISHCSTMLHCLFVAFALLLSLSSPSPYYMMCHVIQRSKAT